VTEYEAAPVWYAGRPSTPELCVPEEPSGRGRHLRVLTEDVDRPTLHWLKWLDEGDALNAEHHLGVAHWLIQPHDTSIALNQEAAKLADRLMAEVPWYEWPDEGHVDLSALWESADVAHGKRPRGG
jgi:hypothetical protein